MSSLARKLQDDLRAERAITAGLLERIKAMESKLSQSITEGVESKNQVKELEEMVADLAINLEMRDKLKDGEAQGGSLVVSQTPKGKKKK